MISFKFVFKVGLIMFRTKDFILMEVIDIRGKRIGFIKDIIIDFSKGEVRGFVVSSYSFFQHTINVLKENIISFNKHMVICSSQKGDFLKFSQIKSMDIINRQGQISGMVEDILFHEFSFNIKGVIASTGFIKNIFSGKEVLLINQLILGEESLLYIPENSKTRLVSVPHKMFAEVECYEKNI